MANRYFVGSGNWDASDTTVWSDTSGGTTGFSVPTSVDDVFFDANSGDCAITASAECDDLNFTGYISTLSGSSTLDIYGSLTMAAGMTRTYTGAITFRATSTGKTLTFNGKTMANATVFDGTGGGWTVQDTWNNGTSNITLTRGTLDTNGQTVTGGTLSASGSSTRTLTLGASTLNLSYWNTSTTTNLTFNANTSTLSFTTANGGNVFNAGGLTFNVVTLAVTASVSVTIAGANTFATLTITGPASKSQEISLSANQTVTGTLTIAGNSLTNRLFVRSSTQGTTRTITAATTTLSNVDFRDITGAGAGSWSGTSIGNALGNSGITFTTPVTRYAVVAGNWSDTATWSVSSGGGGGASVPLCHDTVILNGSSAAGTYTADMPRLGADITCTGFTRTLSVNSQTMAIYGSLTLASGMTLSGNQALEFYGRSSHTITSAGKTYASSINFYALGGTYTLQDNLTTTSTLGIFLSRGTLDANDYNVSAPVFQNSINSTTTMGSGTWSITGTGTAWNGSSSATVNAETSTIAFTDTSTSTKTFAGGGKTYNKLSIQGAGVAQYTITGSNTFATFESTKTVAHTIAFTAGTTQTITNWSVSGSSGNVVTLTSSTTATYALTKAGGGDVRSDYLSIQHSVATPSSTWYAGLNSTNNQATSTAGSGWLFTIPLPTVTTQAVSAITDVTAIGNGNVTDDGSGTITERGVVVSTTSHADPGNTDPDTSDYELVFSDTGSFTEGAFTKSISGLTQLITYYVRAYCLNAAGYDYGTEVSFTTEETPAVAIVSTQDASSITGTTATGNGTIVDANGTVTRRGFAVSTSTHTNPSNTDPDVSDYELVFDASGSFTEGTYTTSLTGLTVNTTYYIRAFNENAVGFSYGSELTFITDRKPSVTLQSPVRQSTTATLNGTVTDAGGDDIDKRGFVWDTVTRTAPGDVAPASSGYANNQSESGTFAAGTFDEAITGLSPNTTYYVRAFAQNSQGYTYSDESQFSTPTFPNSQSLTNTDTATGTLDNTETTPASGIINLNTSNSSLTNI